MKEKVEYIEVEMTFDEFGKKYLAIDKYETEKNKIFDISHLGILISSREVLNQKDVWSPLDSFIIKPKVEKHYEIKTDNEVLKTTGAHMTYFNNSWIESQSRLIQDIENTSLVNSEMFVVDCTVRDTECYYANGQLNHNSWTVPGGKAIPFYSSIRVHLEGKTKIVVKDPRLEKEYEDALQAWKNAGGKKSGIEKPEKPKATKENETTIGYEVAAYTIKNKTAPPDRRTAFRIIFSQGLFDEECWYDQCVKYGIVKVEGQYSTITTVPNDKGKFYKSDWMNILQSSETLYEEIKKQLIDKLNIKLELSNYLITDAPIEEMPDSDEDIDNAVDYDVPKSID